MNLNKISYKIILMISCLCLLLSIFLKFLTSLLPLPCDKKWFSFNIIRTNNGFGGNFIYEDIDNILAWHQYLVFKSILNRVIAGLIGCAADW